MPFSGAFDRALRKGARPFLRDARCALADARAALPCGACPVVAALLETATANPAASACEPRCLLLLLRTDDMDARAATAALCCALERDCGCRRGTDPCGDGGDRSGPAGAHAVAGGQATGGCLLHSLVGKMYAVDCARSAHGRALAAKRGAPTLPALFLVGAARGRVDARAPKLALQHATGGEELAAIATQPFAPRRGLLTQLLAWRQTSEQRASGDRAGASRARGHAGGVALKRARDPAPGPAAGHSPRHARNATSKRHAAWRCARMQRQC